MNTTSSIRAPRSSLSFGVKSGCEEEIARRESPLLKLLLIEKHDSQIWYWRKESNLHHALIWGLRLIRPLHYHCATPAWRFGVKDEGGRMKPAVASASFHPSSLILHPLVWSGRRDSNSRFEFGRLAGFQLPTLPQFGTPGRTRTCNLDVRSVALFQLRYRSTRLLNSDC